MLWERRGFWLLYKRLEAGTFGLVQQQEITACDLCLLLEGIEVLRERLRYTQPRKGA